MKKAILFSVIIFIGQLCFAQKEEANDSIVIKKVDSILVIVRGLMNTDLEAAETMVNYTLNYSKKHDYLRGVGKSYGTLAGVYNYQGKTEKSITHLIKSAQIYESIDDQKLAAVANVNISYSLYEQSQYKEAKQYALKAHNYAQKSNDVEYLILTHTLFGIIGVKTKNSYEYVTKNLKQAKEFSLIQKDTIWLSSVLNLQGEADIEYDKSYVDAIILLNKAAKIIRKKEPNNHFHLGFSYLNLGKAYYKMKNYREALQYNDTSLTHYNALNYTKGLRLTYENRKDILASLGKYKESNEAFELFIQNKDSVFKKEQAFQLNRIRTEYETEQITTQKERAEAKLKLTETINQKNKNYFISAAVIACLILLSSVFYFSRLKAKKKAELVTLELKETQKRLAIEKQYRDSELKALKAQMNPHFIFNALNSIQDYIVLNQKNLASDYLGKFADLIRNYLHFSDTGFISIQDEVHNLKLYLELEKLRFEEQLEYTIQVDETANFDEINIPTMLVQPYVENALKHGLLHKKDNRKLHISISKTSDKIIECTIEDNGIGREKSKKINTKREGQHKSFALKATTERLDLLNYGRDKKIGVEFIDLKDNEKAVGTKVILVIPIIKK
ncbi:histidine kinase [Winogradskyella thalassocola]|uniref:TPR repeat-containing protein n=1 Tax=Winogradskyella thalassocola TaxID=262004 RepID=A0A1G7Z8P6_9FLAO|nr:histidine kinase [Winogradskyella thalassocola]SDH05142.1 TPR repeat-containing protein [Winogradskyella thalassocola]